MKRMLLTIFFAVCLTAAPALAGPPLVCHAIDIGTATSLPWSSGSGWNGAQGSYDLSHLGDDMFALLTPAMPIDVRRETLRRAVIYSASEPSLADTLTRRLVAKANDAQAAGKPDRVLRSDPPASRGALSYAALRRRARRSRLDREGDRDGRPGHGAGCRIGRGGATALTLTMKLPPASTRSIRPAVARKRRGNTELC